MLLVEEIVPNSIDLSTNFLGAFGNRDFENVATKFVKHLQLEDKTFLSSCDKKELKAFGFFNNINDCQGSYPGCMKLIIDYFVEIEGIKIIEEREYFLTDVFIERIIPFVKK